MTPKKIFSKEKLASFESDRAAATNPSSLTHPGAMYLCKDHDRSVVRSHVPESSSSKSSERLSHEFGLCRGVSYLNVNALPFPFIAWKRIRLLKVVLLSSKFHRLATRPAPRLRFSPTHKGTYLRPSLTWEERAPSSGASPDGE